MMSPMVVQVGCKAVGGRLGAEKLAPFGII